jgi:SpoVK/Ycf46/Vps4 family AAA+-type ATPase
MPPGEGQSSLRGSGGSNTVQALRGSAAGSPPQGSALPGRRAVSGWLASVGRVTAAAPLPVKILIILLGCVLAAPLAAIFGVIALIYAPYALATGERSMLAVLSVALWGLAITVVLAHGPDGPRYLLLPLAPVVSLLATVGQLGRWRIPCRTAAWALVCALPVGLLLFRFWHGQPFGGPAAAWLVALVALGYRLAIAFQDNREQAAQTAAGTALAPAVATAGPPSARARPVSSPPGSGGQPGQGTGRYARDSPAGTVRAAQAATGLRNIDAAPIGSQQQATEWPQITIDDAMAELDAMVGLAAVKGQVRSITASVEAARRRAIAGHSTDKPMQHFVFLGPPGTGKTAVARIIAKIFYAYGLLETPTVVEAQRADLVGEYLGATAIKTNELIDSALGGVLFIDEAYSLVNEGDGQGDRFGNEAVQALVKRAEDDRDNLIIMLAGYERQMETFMSSNPGLNSRFGVRIKFPGYSPAELLALADAALAARGELLDPDARPVLRRMFDEIGRRRLADEVGNGRFVRNLLAKAGQHRDARVMAPPGEPTSAELVTLRDVDLELAYAELTARFRGYQDTPTVAGALAELDALVGLEPVKRQVHEIVAQLQVARMRDSHGLVSQPPSRHFVFTGPPGTGKTTVARILGRIFAALGLLVRPEVIEAHRADLVGEHLGATAIKTNKLIDSAMGGVLFIDEAYALHNDAYSGGDAFGSEAVATLLKRAEDDRERLVIVLAGYTADMDRLLRSNPGLASRFSTRIAFPSYQAAQLSQIAQVIAAKAGDSFEPDAVPELESIFARACGDGAIDELGNGRFARSLYERACAFRDVRVARKAAEVTSAELTTLTRADLLAAHGELAG